MTNRQMFALYYGIGRSVDIKHLNNAISVEAASEMISRLKSGTDPSVIADELVDLGGNRTGKTTVAPKKDFKAIYEEAHKAGQEAAIACIPVPMVVAEHMSPLDDNSPIKNQWIVEGGVCGFAEISFAGNTAWARWAKQNLDVGKGWPRGLAIWVHDYGQSLTRKEAYARAFAEVLRNHGIEAYCKSRMD